MDIEKAKEEYEWLKNLCSMYVELNDLKEKSIELDKQLKTKEREYVPILYYPIPYNPYLLNPPYYITGDSTGTVRPKNFESTIGIS